MIMSKLTLDSLVQKGSAGASVSSAQIEARAAAPEKSIPKGGQAYWKAMTVKLDRDQYNALKIHGVVLNKTSQDCISEAVDMWIERQSRDTE
jgi:hypothetical protein